VERRGIRGIDSGWNTAASGTAGHSEQYYLSRIGEGRSQLHGDVKALLPDARDGVRARFRADHRALSRGYVSGSAPALPLIVAKAISTRADGEAVACLDW
jgi:hypothetical protein